MQFSIKIYKNMPLSLDQDNVQHGRWLQNVKHVIVVFKTEVHNV